MTRCGGTNKRGVTQTSNRSGARGFWTSKPAGGSCSFRVPPVASQPLRVTPNRRFCLPSKTAAQSVQPGWSARKSSPQPAQPSSPAPWPLCRSTPLPCCATQPGDPPSRTSPWTRRFWNFSLRPLSRSPPTLLANLRRARKGAAAGPSGHTSELCRLVLDDEASGLAFVRAATDLAACAHRSPPRQNKGLERRRARAARHP